MTFHAKPEVKNDKFTAVAIKRFNIWRKVLFYRPVSRTGSSQDDQTPDSQNSSKVSNHTQVRPRSSVRCKLNVVKVHLTMPRTVLTKHSVLYAICNWAWGRTSIFTRYGWAAALCLLAWKCLKICGFALEMFCKQSLSLFYCVLASH